LAARGYRGAPAATLRDHEFPLMPALARIKRPIVRNGTNAVHASSHAHRASCRPDQQERPMNGIIYLVGLIVVIMFILSFLGLR
jgi:hypothetical protein